MLGWDESYVAMSAIFLNVDLEISATRDLNPLLQALQSDLFPLAENFPFGCLRLEARHPPEPCTLDNSLDHICQAVQKLNGSERDLWNDCHTKVLNVGLMAGDRHSDEFAISPETVRCVAAIGASLTITLYERDLALASKIT